MQHTANEQFKNHQHPLSFDPIKDLGKRDERISTKIKLVLRNNSQFLNLLANGILSLRAQAKLKLLKKKQIEQDSGEGTIPEDFLVSLNQYQKKYQDKFIFISIKCSFIKSNQTHTSRKISI